MKLWLLTPLLLLLSASMNPNGHVVAIPVGDTVLTVFDDYSAAGYDVEGNLLGIASMTGFSGTLNQSRAATETNHNAAAPGSVIKTTWTDSEGFIHEVETKINGTNVDLYVKRHDKLVRAMLRYYPRRR